MEDRIKEIYNTIKENLKELDTIQCSSLECEDCPFNGIGIGCGDLIGEFAEDWK